MIFTIKNPELSTEIIVDETLSKNTLITIKDGKKIINHYLKPKDLRDFIQMLEFVRDRNNRIVVDNATRSEMNSALSLSSIKNKI